MDLSRTVFRDKRLFQSKITNFSHAHPVNLLPPLEKFPLQLGIGAWSQKPRMVGVPSRERSLTIFFSHLDTIHERYGQTDGRTPADS